MKGGIKMNLRRNLLTFLICLLIMSFSSCRTAKVVEIEKYVVPNLDFPEFPELGNYSLESGKVITNEDFFRKLLIFRTSYWDLIDEYNEKKTMMEENKNELQ